MRTPTEAPLDTQAPELQAHFLPRLLRVERRPLELKQPFEGVVQRFADLEGTVALASGGQHDCARFHVLGVNPFLCLRGKAKQMQLACFERTQSLESSPLALVRRLLAHFETGLGAPHDLPLSSGLLGYFAYDLKNQLEELPHTVVDDLQLPDLYLVAPRLIVVHDRQHSVTTLLAQEVENDPQGSAQQHVEDFMERLATPAPKSPAATPLSALEAGFERPAYERAIGRIREYIRAGDVYQVNMSQRYSAPFSGDSFALFARMYRDNPAPFFAYLNAGDHQIISTSPERFLQMRDGRVETRPIKGTRPRGNSAEQDAALRSDLESSSKDDAELSMIVDLLRNDLGRVCRPGSVEVAAHKRVEVYENVFHLVSMVEGILDEGKDAVDLIAATFPGGSITGCPKIRSMEIIDELEPVARHVYTGSVGYLGFDKTMDLSIAIRTATVSAGRIVFSVGGGIVYDSDPASEYEETLHKGRTLMRALIAPD